MDTPGVHELEPLLQRVRAGDGQAFDQLLARLRLYVKAKVCEQLGAGADGRIDRSALVQSVCRRVIVHFHELEGPNVPLLLGWVRAILQNRVNDELRRLARDPVRSVGSDVEAEGRPGTLLPRAAADAGQGVPRRAA
jgi:DNA-directed RNA polymerase specialized sigma24 family protein